jgi:hypothetical protein
MEPVVVVLIGIVAMYFAIMLHNADDIDARIAEAKKKREKDKELENLGRVIRSLFKEDSND